MNALTRLPAEVTIYTASELHPAWVGALPALQARASATLSSTVTVDASAVDEVDGAGVQLLLALQHELHVHGLTLHLDPVSTPLREACRALGVAPLLACMDAGVPA
jgi:ABC-type transporter Mla MlaB component